MRKLFKRLLPLVLTLAMILSTTAIAAADPGNDNSNLRKAYENIMSYAEKNNIPVNMTFQDFMNGYKEQEYASIQEYENIFYSLLVPMEETQTNPEEAGIFLDKDSAWYYNTGTTLPQPANYSKYNLLSTVKKGDIIYEANGGFGITGHIAIVEGIFWSTTQQQYYIRVIEAISDGVVRSVLDDTRVDDKAVSVYRVIGATSTNITNAVYFCIGELGSSYNLDFAKDTSSSETDWYCSELVWAAYWHQGFDIETDNFFNEPGVTPRDIANSDAVAYVAFQ
ncbi:MAG: hypothetical protein K0R84_1624 [Clostridia bacterium]|nr:hypothetical protein [Clostridia bacterium]